jgi:hypothetical protein
MRKHEASKGRVHYLSGGTSASTGDKTSVKGTIEWHNALKKTLISIKSGKRNGTRGRNTQQRSTIAAAEREGRK